MTVTTFYSGAGDGFVSNRGSVWATVREAATGDYNYPTETYIGVSTGKNGDGTLVFYRAFIPFDTSALPDTDTISAATVSLYVTTKTNSKNDGTDWINILETSQADTSTLANADFDTCGDAVDNPTEGATRIDIGDLTTSAYNTFTLNATGIGWISKTGYTKLGYREGHDCTDTDPSYGTSQANTVNASSSEETDVTQDPKLEVTHAAGSTATKLLQLSYYY